MIDQYPTGDYPHDLLTADFDGDGVPDLATANLDSDDVTVLLGAGDGRFAEAPGSPVAVGGAPGALLTADFDGDGMPDLATANYTSDDITVLRNALGTEIRDGDYDGDGMTDLALYQYDRVAGAASFTIRLSSEQGDQQEQTITIPDVDPHVIPVAGDFDGDGKTDAAVVDPAVDGDGDGVADRSRWTFVRSSDQQVTSVDFGAAGMLDRPTPADFDGDGVTDLAMFRADSDVVPGAAEWFILPSRENPGFATRQGAYSVLFGAPGGTDLPAPADYDGDGRADIATFRPSSDLVPGAAQWFILPSGPNLPKYATTDGGFTVAFGAAGNADQPAVADYDGDGRADVATFRSVSDLEPGAAQYFILPSATNAPGYRTTAGGYARTFGPSGAITAVGDYAGDGRPDLATYAPDSAQWRLRTGSGASSADDQTTTFGAIGPDVVPVLAPLYFRLRATGNLADVAVPTGSGGGMTASAPQVARKGRQARALDDLLNEQYGD